MRLLTVLSFLCLLADHGVAYASAAGEVTTVEQTQRLSAFLSSRSSDPVSTSDDVTSFAVHAGDLESQDSDSLDTTDVDELDSEAADDLDSGDDEELDNEASDDAELDSGDDDELDSGDDADELDSENDADEIDSETADGLAVDAGNEGVSMHTLQRSDYAMEAGKNQGKKAAKKQGKKQGKKKKKQKGKKGKKKKQCQGPKAHKKKKCKKKKAEEEKPPALPEGIEAIEKAIQAAQNMTDKAAAIAPKGHIEPNDASEKDRRSALVAGQAAELAAIAALGAEKAVEGVGATLVALTGSATGALGTAQDAFKQAEEAKAQSVETYNFAKTHLISSMIY